LLFFINFIVSIKNGDFLSFHPFNKIQQIEFHHSHEVDDFAGEGQRSAGAGAEDGPGQLGTGSPGEGAAEPTEASRGGTALRSMDVENAMLPVEGAVSVLKITWGAGWCYESSFSST
jgi:hypothetical protein